MPISFSLPSPPSPSALADVAGSACLAATIQQHYPTALSIIYPVQKEHTELISRSSSVLRFLPFSSSFLLLFFKKKVNECFALGFDADVFMAAHAAAEGDADAALRRLWEEHVALPREERDALLRGGLLRRERAPLAALREQERAIRLIAAELEAGEALRLRGAGAGHGARAQGKETAPQGGAAVMTPPPAQPLAPTRGMIAAALKQDRYLLYHG